MSTRIDLFQSIGLSEQKAKETLKNEALASHLENVVTTVSKIVYKLFICVIYSLMMCFGRSGFTISTSANRLIVFHRDRVNISRSRASFIFIYFWERCWINMFACSSRVSKGNRAIFDLSKISVVGMFCTVNVLLYC